MKYSISFILLIGSMLLTNIIFCSAMTEERYQAVSSNDSTQVVKNIKGFLKWYQNNYKQSSGFRLVGTDKSGYYFVDQKECNKYLKHLQSSGYISKVYVDKWKKYFSEMDQKFKDNPQNEGPPEGFDYDLISSTQEPELFYNPTKNLNFVLIKKENNKVIIKSSDIWEHQFTMSKLGGKWKIEDIEMLGYATESNPE